jgi:tRNA modification GTPase
MKNFGENDTIVAISTPPGEGGIGIIRISGENSGIVASKLCLMLLLQWKQR